MTKIDLNIHAKHKDGKFHPVIFHSLDVGYTAQALWDTFSLREKLILANAHGCNLDEMRKFIGAYFSLHDIGKITPSFARRINNLSYSDSLINNGYSSIPVDTHFHTELGHHILKKKFPQHEILWRYLTAHHGLFFTKKELIPQSFGLNKSIKDACGNEKWEQQQSLTIDFILNHFECLPILNKVVIDDKIILLDLCLLSASDWMASNTDNFPLMSDGIECKTTLDKYIMDLPMRARKAIDKSFNNILEWNSKDYNQLFGKKFIPYPSQQVFADCIDEIFEPSLVLIKDLTGNGKTEMMLYGAQKMAVNIGHRRVKYLLPTQATSNTMWVRYQDFIINLTNGLGDIVDLQLIHSNSLFSDVLMDDKVNITNFLRLSKTRFMSQFSLGTIDQALMGLITVRYFYLRLLGLFNSVIIIDELHSYDAYTNKIIYDLIRLAKTLGSSVIASTATLSTKECEQLINYYNGVE